MNNFKNFMLYTPENPDVPGAMYLKSEDGQDWYECQSLFKGDTLKVVYNSAGVITDISRVASALWPAGQSVAEVA
ncbi:TPA: phage tail protein, partial [Escherichia coli]